MKLLIHLAARHGAEEALAEGIADEVKSLRTTTRAGLAVNALFRVERDPFGRHTPWRGAIEIRAEGSDTATRFDELVDGVADRLGERIHADLSSALVGHEHVFVDPDPAAALRYQYLMRRNASFTHAQYLEHYRDVHSRFGVRTPGIAGYVQLHVDPAASRRAAAKAGLGIWAVDSVSELHLASLEGFLAAVAGSPVAREALADEEIFVDRARSFDLCSRVDRDPR